MAPGAPYGLPRLPPDEPDERFDLANPSCDGGFELLEEFVPSRRFNSASSARSPTTSPSTASSSAIRAACAATSATNSSYDGRCGSASGTPEPCHTYRTLSIKTRRATEDSS